MKSMTAFSRQEASNESGSFNLEMRTVNHRYLDINLRLAEEIRFFEPRLRQMIADSLSRGRVDMTIKFKPVTSTQTGLNNQMIKLLMGYQQTLQQIDPEIKGLNVAEYLQWPGVLDMAGYDEKALGQTLEGLLDSALGELQEQRCREGDKIQGLLEQRVELIQKLVAGVREILPEVSRKFRENFQEKLAQMDVDIDDHRLEQELVIFLGKQDIAEELDRLDVHLEEASSVLADTGVSGRRLDFLMQELNREANTLTSKSIDTRLNRASVDMKVLIEQMREQVQNIE